MRTWYVGILAIVGVAALAAAPAFAFVRTSSVSSAANGGKNFLWWPTRQVDYRIQSDCAPMNAEVAAAGEDATAFGQLCRAAIERSFQSWQEAGADGGHPPCTDMVLHQAAETSVRELGYNAADPNEGNTVLFQFQGCLGIVSSTDPCWADDSCDSKYACFSGGSEVLATTRTTSRSADGMLLDADIEVNAAPAPGGHDLSAEVGTPLPGTEDIQDTLTHEVGHLIGLAHNCGTGGAPACTPELMQGTMFGGTTPSETVKRTLKVDDIAGICHIYPPGVDTRTVNLEDQMGSNPVTVPASSCASVHGEPRALGLVGLALLLARRKRRP